MKIYEAIKFACYFTDETELADKIDALTTFPSNLAGFSEEEKKKINTYLRHYHLIEEELAYSPINKIELPLLVHNNRIEFATLFDKPLKILSVCSEDGVKLSYKVFSTYIEVNAKKVLVTFLPRPAKTTFNNDLPERLSARVVAYGIAREHYISQGLYEDAEVWEGRYKDGIKMMFRQEPGVKISARRWM